MMLHQHTVPRLVSLANAARILRTASTLNSSKNTARLARTGSAFQESLAARYNLTKTSIHQQRPRFVSTSSSSSRPAATALGLQSHASRGFAKQSSLFPIKGQFATGAGGVLRPSSLQQQIRAFSKGHPEYHLVRKRRPFRFLWRVMIISTAVVALPAILLFGAPMASLVLVPVAIGGVVGGALLLTGSLLFLVLPIVAVGGVAAFWFISMPASMAVRELNQIIKRSRKEESALRALGSDWEVQSAGPNEWFKWEFPRTAEALDKISIRVGVFDPNDHSERKENTFKWLDRMSEDDDKDDKEDEKESRVVKHKHIKHSSSNSHFEIRNNSDTFVAVENMSVIRENDHILIEIEDDGAKLLSQKLGKRFLLLAQIVDRAASEMEGATPGLKLGEQVVLVQRRQGESFWDKISIHGDLALRIPVDRQWVHDVTEE
ncbi:hypothetical protein BGZ95_011960 [Linnemannia exigua]|uniref:Uncharacterized protein n=1 Tax=Linnemannia exigua TaxID=604196 RepID=A0AAD4D9F0_9FUNG|nr:hypothetical protein BGZ95_011960 [Linnemannia exigua]